MATSLVSRIRRLVINTADIIVFDLETGSVDPKTTIPLSLSAIVYNARNLDPIAGATFDSLMKPKEDEWDKIQDEALNINGITLDELRAAPDREAVWNQFVSFVKRFKKGNFHTGYPIAAGQNIKNFDLIIIDRLCQEFGPVDKEGKQNLFNRRFQLDLLDFAFAWFENQQEPKNFKLDTLREYFGLSKEGAHTSLVDVEQSGELITRFLRLHRRLFGMVPGLKGVHRQSAA